MKKLLLVFALTFSVSTSFASITLKGTISNIIDSNEKIKGVVINISDKKSDPDGAYKITNFQLPTPGNPAKIAFTKDGYENHSINVTVGPDGLLFDGKESQNIEFKISPPNPDDPNSEELDSIYTLNIAMIPNMEPVISGIVIDDNGEPLADVTVSYEATINSYNFKNSTKQKTKKDGKFTLDGHLGTDGEFIPYDLKFEHYHYKEKMLYDVKVFDKLVSEESDASLNFKFTELNSAGSRERDMEAFTNRRCEDTMPKYLVGANCGENMELKGDARDIAMWIQKFGGKITSLISLFAVIMIVWNAFILATAAGDSEKVSQGKKGILWTLLGLILTMFAYVIVKTVIALTYTS